MTLTITLGLPPRELSPNYRSRSHWPRTNALKAYRRESALMCRQALDGRRPQLKVAAVHYEATWKDRRSIRDEDNLVATMKAALDGLVDAELLADDKGVQMGRPVQVVGSGPHMAILVEWEDGA